MLFISYNFKVYNFLNGEKQIRIYNHTVPTDFERKKEKETEVEFNPFTQEFGVSTVLHVKDKKTDNERSQAVSNYRAKQKIYELARANDWEYFLTLTFKEDRYNFDLLTKKLSKWINNIKRDYAPNLKYIFVPELHKDGALHFHGIISDIGNLPLVDGGHKDKKGNVIYNIDCYKLGFTTATNVSDSERVASYITKYITKDLCSYSFGKKKYWASRNLKKPDIVEYHITADEIDEFLLHNNDLITFEKTIDNPFAHTKIKIVELNENIV